MTRHRIQGPTATSASDRDGRAAPGAKSPRIRVDGWLKLSVGLCLLLCAVYLLPLLPRDVVGQYEYYAAWFPLLVLAVLLAATAARDARDSATRNFWWLFTAAHVCWLLNWLFRPLVDGAGSWPMTFTKDVLLLAMYCLLAVAVDLRPGLLKSELQRLRSILSAISSVLLIVGIFGYFALVPALTGLAAYETPFEIIALLDAYIALRFLVQALLSSSPAWRSILFLLALSFGITTVADLLEFAYAGGLVTGPLVEPGQPLAILWMLNYLPLYVATRVSPGRPQVTPRIERGDGSDSLNLAPVLAYSIAIPVIHMAGYGFGLLPVESRGVRDLFVLAWLVAAAAGLAWQYLLLRGRLRRAEGARMQAEQESLELHAQLRQAQRIELMGQLSGGMAHEFGNSLFGAESWAQRILKDSQDADGRVSEEHARGLVDALSGSRELIRKFGFFGRHEEPEASLVNVSGEVRDTLELLRPGLGKDVRLHFHCDEGDISAIARQQDLQQIVFNIVLNARDAVGEAGFIDVHVRRGLPEVLACTSCGALITGEQVWIRVSDSGPGVPAELRQRIFEPLVTSKAAGDGSGLGLSIVHTIVHQLRGHVVLGEPRNAHCSFTVFLPSVELETSRSLDREGRVHNLLVVESDQVLADAVRRNAGLHDMHVNHVTSVDAARIILTQPDDRPDTLVVGNLRDPIDMLTVLEQAKRRPGIRTVLCCRRSLRNLLASQECIDVTLEQPVDDELFASTLRDRRSGAVSA